MKLSAASAGDGKLTPQTLQRREGRKREIGRGKEQELCCSTEEQGRERKEREIRRAEERREMERGHPQGGRG